jgi:hypothetical protein
MYYYLCASIIMHDHHCHNIIISSSPQTQNCNFYYLQQHQQSTTIVQTEQNTKWANSRAKANLICAINQGTVPLDPKKDGQPRMKLHEIYDAVDGCEHFDYGKFSSRLAAVRKKM